MARILGIDPGSNFTGYGVIQFTKNQVLLLTCGVVRIDKAPLPNKLSQIFTELDAIVHTYQPEQMAIEQVFMHKNANSALKLGQARGAAIVAVSRYEIDIAEYSARQIKQAVVGYGNAQKEQVQHMVAHLLNMDKAPQADAADALAVALCHGYTRSSPLCVIQGKDFKQGKVQ